MWDIISGTKLDSLKFGGIGCYKTASSSDWETHEKEIFLLPYNKWSLNALWTNSLYNKKNLCFGTRQMDSNWALTNSASTEKCISFIKLFISKKG